MHLPTATHPVALLLARPMHPRMPYDGTPIKAPSSRSAGGLCLNLTAPPVPLPRPGGLTGCSWHAGAFCGDVNSVLRADRVLCVFISVLTFACCVCVKGGSASGRWRLSGRQLAGRGLWTKGRWMDGWMD